MSIHAAYKCDVGRVRKNKRLNKCQHSYSYHNGVLRHWCHVFVHYDCMSKDDDRIFHENYYK